MFDFGLSALISQELAITAVILAIIGIWDLIWKAAGLWKSARNYQFVWFIAILLFNTIGILPIIYIYFFQKELKKVKSKKKKM